MPQLIFAALAFFLGVFAVWAVVVDNPYGGEPMVAVPIDVHAAATRKPDATALQGQAGAVQPPGREDGKSAAAMAPAQPAAPAQAPAANTKTVTIIDGKTGARQDVVIPGGPSTPNTPSPPERGAVDQRFVEMTTHGPIPKISVDGVRPAEAFARPVKPLPGKPDAPRIALIVGGLGVSAGATAEAIAKLPGAVTLAFMPYSTDIERVVARARDAGHEMLLQLPMEPFNYPDNDPGPQTLLTSVTPEQNLDRLYWLMSRFQGYVGVTVAMGARFTASEQSFAPILRETAKRGLIFVDDGTNPRSVAGPHRRRRQSAVRQGRDRDRCGADSGRDRPRAGAAGIGGARARHRGRHILGAAGVDRAHRQMGESGSKATAFSWFPSPRRWRKAKQAKKANSECECE